MDGRLTITEVANAVGVTPRTIMRWEKAGKIRRSKRDWRGWRFYYKEDIEEIKRFFETCYEYDEENGAMLNISKEVISIFLVTFLTTLFVSGFAYAESSLPSAEAAQSAPSTVEINLDQLPVMGSSSAPITEDVKYTLGPNDVIDIEVRRHPEFSGEYTINSEGKIEYKFVGDILVTGLTKAELKDRITEILSEFIIEPDIDVTIAAYLSKVFYVVGEVARPGKFYMKGNTVTAREALVQAGLPMGTAAMRRSRLITPNKTGEENFVKLDVYKLLFEGDLSCNLEMQPGDVLYVPPTNMTKIIRAVSPVTGLTGQAAGVARTGMGF